MWDRVGSAHIIIIAMAILFVLFMIQRFGTGGIGILFSPIILVWFAFLTGIGLYNILTHDWRILLALGPNAWLSFLIRNGHHGWIMLGGVVLCITGAAPSPFPPTSRKENKKRIYWYFGGCELRMVLRITCVSLPSEQEITNEKKTERGELSAMVVAHPSDKTCKRGKDESWEDICVFGNGDTVCYTCLVQS